MQCGMFMAVSHYLHFCPHLVNSSQVISSNIGQEVGVFSKSCQLLEQFTVYRPAGLTGRPLRS